MPKISRINFESTLIVSAFDCMYFSKASVVVVFNCSRAHTMLRFLRPLNQQFAATTALRKPRVAVMRLFSSPAVDVSRDAAALQRAVVVRCGFVVMLCACDNMRWTCLCVCVVVVVMARHCRAWSRDLCRSCGLYQRLDSLSRAMMCRKRD